MKMSPSIIQLCRYGIIGLATNAAGYLVYLLITHTALTPKIAMSFLYLTGVIIGFFGNRTWTFGSKEDIFSTGARYIIAHILGYFLNLLTLIVMVDHLGYPHQGVQALAIFIVAGFLFLLFKFFVFKRVDSSELEHQ